ncbi:MAG: redoxin domain-containing protein [Sphaerochaetaceae bacterium]|nr:redoxin domain-containing protein [Sphaerochaetaceae bacterium]
MMILAFFAFLSGIVTILSPCILPVLPIILSGTIGGKRKPVGIVTGFIFSFSLFTLALSFLVQTLSISVDTLRIVAIVIIISFGITLLIPKLQLALENILSKVTRTKSSSKRDGFFGGVITGLSLGLVWTPCVGPIMASVISLAVSQQVDGGSLIIVAAYSLGTAIPMFAIMAGGRKLLNHFPKIIGKTKEIQRFFGIIMVAAGLMIGFGIDRNFQTFILKVFPNYGTGLTGFEQGELVQNALDSRNDSREMSDGLDWSIVAESAKLSNYGKAPELIAKGPWINTEEDISMESLKGKVVLIDFMTYSCINCVRTIPHLIELYDKYEKYGLEIIAVHSPEFPFERNEDNVRAAIKDLNITWPVVQDNDFSQWNSYNNRYWPAQFFIDKDGEIRYFHFGEGGYDEAEQVIRTLLQENGVELENQEKSGVLDQAITQRTPEIYLGYSRSKYFALSEDSYERDSLTLFEKEEYLEVDQWSISGEWIIRNDFIEIDGEGELELLFRGKDLFIVIEPRDDESNISVEINGKKPQDTADVINGELIPNSSRLYHLGSFSSPFEKLLTLKISGHVRLFTFTFG